MESKFHWFYTVGASPLSHDTIMQLVLLLDVGIVPTGPLAAFTVVTTEDGGQLLLGNPIGGEGDSAFLSQAAPVLHNKAQKKTLKEQDLLILDINMVQSGYCPLKKTVLFIFFWAKWFIG